MTQALWETADGGVCAVSDKATAQSAPTAFIQRAASSTAQHDDAQQGSESLTLRPSSTASANPPTTVGGKLCSRCKAVKSLDHFCRDPTKKIGYQSWCKSCYREHHEKRAMTCSESTTESMCSICKRVKPASEFIKDARRPTGLDTRCKECRRAHSVLVRCGLLEAEKRCAGCGEVKPSTEYKVPLLATLAAAMACSTTTAAASSGASGAAAVTHAGAQPAATAAPAPVPPPPAALPAADALCRLCLEQRRQEQGTQRVLQPTVAAKCCVRCQLVKPAAAFIRDTRKKTGLGPRCKCCEQEYVREKRYRKQQQLLLEQQQGRRAASADDGDPGATEGGQLVLGDEAGQPAPMLGCLTGRDDELQAASGRQEQRPKRRPRRRQEGTGRGAQRTTALTDTSTAGCGAQRAISSSTSPAACVRGMEVNAPSTSCAGVDPAEQLLAWSDAMLGFEQVHWPDVGGATAAAAWVGVSAERKRASAGDGEGTSPQCKRRARQPSRGAKARQQGSEGTTTALLQLPDMPYGSDACWGGEACGPAAGLPVSPSGPLAADVAAALSALCAWVSAPAEVAAASSLQAAFHGEHFGSCIPAMSGGACDGLAASHPGHDSEFESECFDLSAAVAAVADGGICGGIGVGGRTFRSLLPDLSPLGHQLEATSPPRYQAEGASALPVNASPTMSHQQQRNVEPRSLSRGGAPVDAELASAFWSFRSPTQDQLQPLRRHSEAGASDQPLPSPHQLNQQHPQPQWWWCQWNEAQEQTGEAHQPDCSIRLHSGVVEGDGGVEPCGAWFCDSVQQAKQAVSVCLEGDECAAGTGGVVINAGPEAEVRSAPSGCRPQIETEEEEEEEQTVLGVQSSVVPQQHPSGPAVVGGSNGGLGGSTSATGAQPQPQQQRRAMSVSSIRGPYHCCEPPQGQAATSAHAPCWDTLLPSQGLLSSISVLPSHAPCLLPHWGITAGAQAEHAACAVPMLPAACAATPLPAAAATEISGANGGTSNSTPLLPDAPEVGAAFPRSASVEEFSQIASFYLRSYEQELGLPSSGSRDADVLPGGECAEAAPGLCCFADHDLAVLPTLGSVDLFQSPV